MSGKKTKTTGQQDTKNSTSAVSASKVASTDVIDSTKSEPAIVLPGHYVPVGSQPILTGESTTADVSSEAAQQSVSSELPETNDLPGLPPAVFSGIDQLLTSSLLPETDDFEVLEVRAVSERGFWRCGRFWSRQPVNVFASDDPDGDNAANNAHLGICADSFISHDDATRLKSEPNLVVNVIDAVTEKS
ncbi:hypothetical protein STW0522KLE44_42310 [Klebsiella sp. STW0522-44]|nr:hypothetical protein STW0522KLE44_42310 [Klebsiella sp. STW0522-44]